MKEKQHNQRPCSRVVECLKKRHQPLLKNLIQAHFQNGSLAASSPPIQRLVADRISSPNILYVSQSWLDEKYEGQAGKANKNLLDPDGENFKFKSDYHGVDFLSRFKDSWEINPSFRVRKINQKEILATLFSGKRKGGESRGEWHRMDKEYRTYVSQNHILYDFQGIFEKLTGKPVFHLFNYTDPDSDSEVDKAWEDGLKRKACVLISMIYERALAGGEDATLAKSNIVALLESFGVTGIERIGFNNIDGLKLPTTREIYRLVEALHTRLRETESRKRYDMSHVNEKLLETQYELVAAPNCSLDKLGDSVALPCGVYLFHVGNRNRNIGAGTELLGHATTVRVIREVNEAFPSGWNIPEYFKDYNEPVFNSTQSVLQKDTVVGSIWKKK